MQKITLKKVLSHTVGIVSTLWVMIHLLLVAINGRVIIYEPNVHILTLELTVYTVILILQLQQLKRWKAS